MLDASPHAQVDANPQDTGRARDFAPTPSGRRIGWFVVASYPKAERRAHASLHHAGFEAYLPLLTIRRPDRSYHTAALFPGYLFVRLDLAKPWHPVRYAPGVFSLLAIEGIPTPCPQMAVEALQAGEELRSMLPPRDIGHRPGAACEAVLGGGSTVDGVVVSVRGQKATVMAVMFGSLREIVVDLDNLRLRNE